MTTGFIICGALAREVLAIIKKHGWDAEVAAIPAIDHAYPERIAPHVEAKIEQLQQKYARLLVVFGDCGMMGALDVVLDKLQIERISGPHCYQWYAGDLYQSLVEEEPGTYFLTDFMVRSFRGLIAKSMGLDRFPELRHDYFRNYKRLVFLAQKPDLALTERARAIAAFLNLPLEVRATGYNQLEAQLVAWMDKVRFVATV